MIPAAVSKKAPVHTDAVIVVVNACLAIHSARFASQVQRLRPHPEQSGNLFQGDFPKKNQDLFSVQPLHVPGLTSQLL